MANLEDLISKIKEDGNNKAEQILKNAKDQESRIIDKEKSEANKVGDTLIKQAEDESKVIIEKAISNAELRVRDLKLGAKQSVLTEVFNEALRVLYEMEQEQFLGFVKASILNSNIDGDEIISFNKEKIAEINKDFIKGINKELKQRGKLGNIKLNEEHADIKDGFILSKGGIEINFTYDEILDMHKDELEQELSALLF